MVIRCQNYPYQQQNYNRYISGEKCVDIQDFLKELYGPQCTKPVFGVSYKARLKPVSSATETSLKIEILLVASLYIKLSKKRITSADQSAPMCRLVCALAVGKPRRHVLFTLRPICYWLGDNLSSGFVMR